MASRDRSQGFGFVYMNLESLLSNKEQWTEEGPLPTFNTKTVNFNKDAAVAPVTEITSPETTAPKTSVEQIRENLDRLQSLHQRIHVMLQELNQMGARKKNPKGDS